MRLPTSSLGVALATTAFYLPSVMASSCLSYNDASTLATNFGKLVSNYSQKLANQTLAPNFIDYSESVNTLMDNGGSSPVALLGQTFSSRAQYETASATQPAVPFAVKNLWYTCDTVIFRWESALSPNPVIGISVGHTVPAPKGNTTAYQFDEIWGEFDSAAWLVDLGFKITPPAGKAKAKGRREVGFES